MSYSGSGNAYLAGKRYAAKNAQRDRRDRDAAQALAAAEQACDEAEAAYMAEPYDHGSPSAAYQAAWKAHSAARDALFDLDPGNYRFS